MTPPRQPSSELPSRQRSPRASPSRRINVTSQSSQSRLFKTAARCRVETLRRRALDLNEAARFLKMHPRTVRRLAKAGALPGKLWCFLETDLADYLRSLYGSSRQVSQGSTKEATLWHFSRERSRVTGGCDSRPPMASRYANLLGLPTGATRKSTKIKSARHSGDSTS